MTSTRTSATAAGARRARGTPYPPRSSGSSRRERAFAAAETSRTMPTVKRATSSTNLRVARDPARRRGRTGGSAVEARLGPLARVQAAREVVGSCLGLVDGDAEALRLGVEGLDGDRPFFAPLRHLDADAAVVERRRRGASTALARAPASPRAPRGSRGTRAHATPAAIASSSEPQNFGFTSISTYVPSRRRLNSTIATPCQSSARSRRSPSSRS